jgi:tetratricopeptide (TPR) repeat protein
LKLLNVDAAIEYWEVVADQEGELALAARIQQATAVRRAGRENEALKVIDEILKTRALSAGLRLQLLYEKAELHLLLAETVPANLNLAVKTLEELRDGSAPLLWQVRGAYLTALAHQKRGRIADALEVCYNITSGPGLSIEADPEIMAWIYRVGFLAVDLLEQEKKWEGAAIMAERLAATGGDQAVAARDIATRIRLEHFLWDEKK